MAAHPHKGWVAMMPFGTKSSLVLSAALALVLGLPAIALPQSLPAYARPVEETITGTVAALDGPFGVHLYDDRGFVDAIALQPSTVLSPPGLMLSPGTAVVMHGFGAGNTFVADAVNARVSYVEAAPPLAYFGPGWWYPGFPFGYAPAYLTQIVIVNGGRYFRHRRWNGGWRNPWKGGWNGAWHNGWHSGWRGGSGFTIPPSRPGPQWGSAFPGIRSYSIRRAGVR